MDGQITVTAIGRTLIIDETLYPFTVVQRTCYQVAGELFSRITRQGGNLLVELVPLEEGVEIPDIERRFLTLLGDFSLREKIEESTRTIRDHLVAVALGEVIKKVDRADGASSIETANG